MKPFATLLAALLPATLLAQAVPTTGVPLSRVVPIHTAPADPLGGEYGVWAVGHGFKASFHGGFALHVDDAHGRASVALAVAGCRIGATELASSARAPAMSCTDWRCEYDHGAFVEAYDVRPHGVEQTFVFATRPAARGELVVELRVASTLVARMDGEGRGGLHFAGADGAWRIGYGAATAIDANGRARALRTELDGERVRLVLDAEWLAHAAWPLTIDPLVQPNPALIVPERVVDVDLLRDDDETTRNLWVALTTESASGDRDLLVRRFDDGLTNGVDVFVDASSTNGIDEARLAACGGERKVAIVFTRVFATTRAVRWHLHDKDDTTLRTAVGVLTPPAGSHDWRADVGGTRAFSLGSRMLLVWQRETAPTFQQTSDSRVFAALLDVSTGGNGTLAPPFRLDARDDFDQDAPTLTPEAEGGAAFSWVAAWRARGPGIAPFRVFARRVGSDGLVGSRFDAPTGLILLTQGNPRIAGADGRYLLVYGNGPTSSGGGFIELTGVRIDWAHGAANAVTPHGAFSLEAGFPTNAIVESVAYDSNDRSHWVVTRRDAVADVVRATKLGYTGRTTEFGELVQPLQENTRGSAVVFDDDGDRFLVLAATEHTTATQPGRLHLAVLDYEPVAPPTEYGTTCNLGRMRWNGSQHIGAELTSTDLLQGAPLTGTVLAFALAPASLPLDVLGAPTCTLLADVLGPGALGTIAGVTDAGGRLALPLPLPEHLPAMTLHLQAVQLTLSPTTLGVTTTRGLRVELGR